MGRRPASDHEDRAIGAEGRAPELVGLLSLSNPRSDQICSGKSFGEQRSSWPVAFKQSGGIEKIKSPESGGSARRPHKKVAREV